MLGELSEAGEAWRAEPEPERTSSFGARPRVLVAEDDPMVSSYLARLLSESGYDVRLARHGGEALQIALRSDRAFDLVITDVRMPVLDGWELSRRLGERWPDLPVIYISGYDVELTYPSARRGRGAFLRKPFEPDELMQQVVRLLEGG
jgi:CheY-like chemotaxis protein